MYSYSCCTEVEIDQLDFLQATVGSDLFQFWGWNNEVHMFEPVSATWTEPLTQVKEQG